MRISEMEQKSIFRFPIRKSIKIFLDILSITLAYYFAYVVRFNIILSPQYYRLFISTLPIALLTAVLGVFIFQSYQSRWEYSSIRDLILIFFESSWNLLIFVLSLYFFQYNGIPRSVLIIFWMLQILFLGGIRLSYRIFREFNLLVNRNKKRVLVIGAGNAGEMIIRQMKNDPQLKIYPVGIIDDDSTKIHTKIHGVPVLGTIGQLPEIVRAKKAEEIIIAVPSATVSQMRRIVHACEKTGIDFKTVPGPREIVNGSVTLNQIREVRIEDLLDRKPIQTNMEAIRNFVRGKTVLVTGAGGSIGSELSRQIMQFEPKKLICLDRTENSLFYLEKELSKLGDSGKYDICIADITDIHKCNSVFSKAHPDIVFHAAAYKHVPLMELHPEEAVRNNIIGTMNIFSVSDKYHVKKFVLISTDKAVKPTSIMGASKRVTEIMAQSYSENTTMSIITVRFGNVLGSYGSVIPLFQKQIARGGPVTVTHPDMRRFFMTIPEAVKLILESAKMGKGGEIFILNMGEPVRLLDVARHLIRSEEHTSTPVTLIYLVCRLLLEKKKKI